MVDWTLGTPAWIYILGCATGVVCMIFLDLVRAEVRKRGQKKPT